MGPLTGHHHLNGHLFRLQLVGNPRCGRCQHAYATASHVPCDCEALATIRFRHLGQHFVQPGDFHDISISRTLHLFKGWAAECGTAVQKNRQHLKCTVHYNASPHLFYSILFYSCSVESFIQLVQYKLDPQKIAGSLWVISSKPQISY